jgi:hypothetical protein
MVVPRWRLQAAVDHCGPSYVADVGVRAMSECVCVHEQ